jgi:hypothetical protein
VEPRLVCAANKYEDGTIIIGVRHYDRFMQAQLDNLPRLYKMPPAEQGFIDQFGMFYTRVQALVLAEKNNQIIRHCGGDGNKLFSENLY